MPHGLNFQRAKKPRVREELQRCHHEALREFPRASGEMPELCADKQLAPAPSPPLQAFHLFQVHTCPCFAFQPMQIPYGSFTFSSLRQDVTNFISLPPFIRQLTVFTAVTSFILLCLKCSQPVPVLLVFGGMTERTLPVWCLTWECPADSP